MKRVIVVFMFFTICFPQISHAEIVTESWMRQAGISCGGGLSVEMQGELDAAVIKRLRLGHVSGDGQFKISETESLLKQFQKEEKSQTYVNYVNCLLTLMNMASSNSQLPPEKVVLESPIAIASLETIKRGQRFVMTTNDTVAIKNHAILFTINKIPESKPPRVDFTWSNSELNTDRSTYTFQSKVIVFEKGCSIVPYKIDFETKQVSFLSNC